MKEQRHTSLRRMTTVAVFAAVLAVCAQISIPLPSGVPITLQTFGIALCGYCLSAPSSLSAVAVYLALGAVGAPVFASFGAGVAILLGRTGGFLFGFLPLSFFCSLGRKKRFLPGVAIGAAGLILCHIFGSVWFSVLTGNGLWASALLVSVPYLWKDILSLAAACLISVRLRRMIPMLQK